MLAHGNGTPQQCARNLLATGRGECPYERCKGLDPDLVDAPHSQAAGLLAEDTAWLFDNYEPRVSRNSAGIVLKAAAEGSSLITAEIEVEEA